MNNTSPIVFDTNPDINALGRAFDGGRYFSKESLDIFLPVLPCAKLLVATIQGRIVGALVYQIQADSCGNTLLIPSFIEVLPEFREKKIGSRLFEKVKELHRGEVSQIFTSIPGSNPSFEGMLTKVGFRSMGNDRFIKSARV